MMAADSEESFSLENLKKVDGGYFISEDNIIELAYYIQDLQEDNNRLEEKVITLENSLNEERQAVQILLNEKDNIIKLQNEQIEDYKKLYRNKGPNIREKLKWAAGGAGIAAVIMLFSGVN